MGALVAWLIAADWLSTSARRRPDGGRVTAWLSVASLAILSISILWGVFGATRHGVPPAPHPAIVGPPAPVAGDAPVGGPQP
jgi:cytochrome b